MGKTKTGFLPNLIIIGAMKAGTTSLHYYLSQHPEIAMSRKKELLFFVREFNWHKGQEWYRSHFTKKAKIRGESSPPYTNYPFYTGVPERMHSIIPHAKLIYIVRDPIERILSHYIHRYTDGEENRMFEEALSELDSNPYVRRSKYYMQLEQYLKYFNESSILTVTAEALDNNRGETMRKIFKFLNVDDSFYSHKFLSAWHISRFRRRKTKIGLLLDRTPVTKIVKAFPFELQGAIEKIIYFPFSKSVERPVLDDALRCKLVDHLRADMDRLKSFTGCSFSDWSL